MILSPIFDIKTIDDIVCDSHYQNEIWNQGQQIDQVKDFYSLLVFPAMKWRHKNKILLLYLSTFNRMPGFNFIGLQIFSLRITRSFQFLVKSNQDFVKVLSISSNDNDFCLRKDQSILLTLLAYINLQ